MKFLFKAFLTLGILAFGALLTALFHGIFGINHSLMPFHQYVVGYWLGPAITGFLLGCLWTRKKSVP